jgi:DNA-directed RNA polymerase
MNQIEFQRLKNAERKEKVAAKIAESKSSGTYELFTDNEMIIKFSDHLKREHATMDPRESLYKLIKQLKESEDVYIDTKSSIYDVLSVTIYKYVSARLFTLVTRGELIFGIRLLYDWEERAALYLVEEFVRLFPEQIQRIIVFSEGKREVQILPTEEYAQELERHEASLIESQKVFWPMAVQPKDWSSYRDTPFHDPLINYPIVKRDYHPSNFDLEGMFEVANALASTSYKVNPIVLKEAKKALKDGNMDLFKSKKYSTWSDRSAKRGSKSSALRKIKAALKVADHFKDSTFWHVWCMDYRGRCYAVDRILDPQGSELEKALHVAEKAVPVGQSGIRELKIALLTAMGDDKISLKCRLEKASSLLESGILEKWVLGTDDGWKQADEPFFTLTYANELVKWKASGYDYNMKSAVFVTVDASCSGLQLAAGCQADNTLASLVNMSKNDSVGDLYSAVGRSVYDAYEGPLKDRVLSRKLWKRPTMCTLYSLTFIGAWKYIREELDKDAWIAEWGYRTVVNKFGKEEQEITQEYKDEITVLTHLFRDTAMAAVAPSAYSILSVVKSWASDVCASESFKETKFIKWTAPSGMIVNQKKMVLKERPVRATLSDKGSVRHNMYKPTDKVATGKHELSIVANLIHSMDAAVMWGVVRGMSLRNMPMLHCHDAFGTVPGHAAEMGEIIREIFLDVVIDNPLESVKKELEGRYNVELQDLPAQGDLDVSVILDSPHAFR